MYSMYSVLLPLLVYIAELRTVHCRFPRLIFLEMRDVTTLPRLEFNLVNLTHECLLSIKEVVVSTVEQCHILAPAFIVDLDCGGMVKSDRKRS